jgi:hypothetical protein
MATYTQADIDKALSAKGTGNYTPEQIASSNALLGKGDALGKSTGQQYNPTYTTYQPQAISATGMNTPQQPMNVPQYTPPPPDQYDLKTILSSLSTPSAAETAAKDEQTSILGEIKGIFDKQGTQSARQLELEQQAGLPDMQKNLNSFLAQINAVNSSAFQATQNAEGRLAPTFAIYGEQAQIERQKSAQTYGLSAAAAALTNNISLAKEYVGKAVDAEFKPLESRLAFAKQLLDINRDTLSDAKNDKLTAIQAVLNERTRILAEQKTEREGIYNLMTTLAQNGVAPEIVKGIQGAKSYSDAITMAAPYMQSPEQKLALKNAEVDLKIKKLQMDKLNKEIGQIGQPTVAERKEAAAAMKEAEAALPLMQDKLNTLASLKSHPGMKGSVGAYGLARFTPLSIDKADRQDFIAGVSKLTGDMTLQNLIDAKARGAAFGALSEGELALLANSSTKINNWALKDKDGKVYGYDIDEASFQRELAEIERLTQRGIYQKQGSFFNSEETSVLDDLYNSTNTSTPMSYYQ